MTTHAQGRGTVWHCRTWIWSSRQLCWQAVTLGRSTSSPLKWNGTYLWDCQRGGVNQRKPKCSQQRLSTQQRTCCGSPLRAFTSACLSPTLRVLPGPCAEGRVVISRPASQQELREEATLVLSRNNEGHSGSPLITLTPNVQTSALLSPQNASLEPPAVTLKSGCTLSSEHSCLNFPLILSRSSWSLS